MLYNMEASANQPPNYQLGLIMALIVVVLTLIISALTSRFIELPGRNFVNRMLKTRRRQIKPLSFKV